MKILGIILAVLAVLFLLFAEELYRYLFCRGSSKLFRKLFDSKGHDEAYYQARDAAAERLKATPCETYTIRNDRGQTLKGYYYPCGAEGKQIAFLIHGYRSDHLDTGGLYYEYYKSRGIDFFCCDHTAHGDSEGHFIGFDVLETRDCLQWIDFLREKFGEDVQIILHGFSMGGGTVLQMSGHCPEQVKFIIEDSGYRNARASLNHQIGPMYGPMRWLNRLIAGYDIDDSDVTESLARSRVPILFVHGKDDKLVPYENGPMLYAMYQGEKDCFFPEGTRHVESMYTSPKEYGEKIDQFIKRYISHKASAK